MSISRLKDYYETGSSRFWDASSGPVGRDLVVAPLVAGCSGVLLEYGCGSGSLLLHLARESRFSRAIGVDLSERTLESVRAAWHRVTREEPDKLELLTPDNDLLPGVGDASIDALISVATIEHVLDPYVVLDELYRVAKPQATLVCSVPNYAYLKNRLMLLRGELPRTGTDEPVRNWRKAGWDGMHLHTFTQSAFTTLLKDCGWEPVRWTGWGTKYPWLRGLRQRYPGLLSGEIIAVCRKVSRG